MLSWKIEAGWANACCLEYLAVTVVLVQSIFQCLEACCIMDITSCNVAKLKECVQSTDHFDGDTLQHRLYTYSDRSGEPENQRTGAEETEWSGRQRQRELEEFHSQTRSEQKHQECTKRSPTLEAVHVPQSRGGAGTPGACRTRIEVRAALGSTGTAT